MNEFIDLFLRSNTPWAVLFVGLFWWFVKGAKERENENNLHIKELQEILRTDLKKIDRDIQVLVELWKTLIEEEIKRRERENK